MSKHFIFGPSASHRWLGGEKPTGCSGSIDLIQFLKAQRKIPERTTNPAAERGTAVHYVGEQVLLKTRRVGEFTNIPIKEDGMTTPMVLTEKNLIDAGNYADFCFGVHADSKGKMVVEESYDMSRRYDVPIGGTTDFTNIGGDGVLTVVDYKNGVMPVTAEWNPQIMIYGLGAYYKYRAKLTRIRKIRMVIFQPNARDKLPTVREWTITTRRLLQWEKQVLRPTLEKIKAKKGILIPSDHNCQWCEAKPFCDAFQQNKPKLVRDLVVSSSIVPTIGDGTLPSPESLSEKELIAAIQNADHVIEFYNSCKKLGLEKVEDNETALPGFRMRTNLGNRTLASQKVLATAFKKAKIDQKDVTLNLGERTMNIGELEVYLRDEQDYTPEEVKKFIESVTTRKPGKNVLVEVDEVEEEFSQFVEQPKARPRAKKRG